MKIEFDVLSWGVWSPNAGTQESWQTTTVLPCFKNGSVSPVLGNVGKMQTRRFSVLTKMMLSAAFDCVDDIKYPAVFASRHGELARTTELLKSISLKESLSPTAFSQSVHNTASGLFSILQKNTEALTSIAAGEQTFTMAAIESYAQSSALNNPVLLVFGQDEIPEAYQDFFASDSEVISLALLINLRSSNKGCKLIIEPSTNGRNSDTIKYVDVMNAITKEDSLNGVLEGWAWTIYQEQ
ncbi:3-oxoacyl-ACP synthase [Parashewanella curva]|uniref:3-oxoacyl-ACP synthase n=1 Tax=Parashewanella curva TaxID=2338552 RepID=A0A3L8Q0G8_9GAMM|nr:beta-ketoacyl synthase chain length factor [Parashewanella curva]RLV60519.1 3-oxoacyl-ACP synthase [Parashewanella curva]